MAATAEYLPTHGIPEQPADLAHHQCLRFGGSNTQTHFRIVDRAGVTQRVPVGGRLVCRDIIGLYSAMTSGLGIGILPGTALQSALESGALVEVLRGCKLEGATLYALVPAGRHKLPRVRAFTDWLAGFMGALDGLEGG